MSKRLIGILLCIAAGLILTACGDKETVYRSQRRWTERTVAVVAPIGDKTSKERLERTAEWFLENFREAQRHNDVATDLKLEWYDELSEDLVKLSRELAGREDVIAVVGPFGNESIADFAPACKRTLKPLMAPTATSEDIAVTTSGLNINKEPFLWALTESDVSFTGLMMTRFASLSKYYDTIIRSPKAAFFSPGNAYGMTFNYWAPFYSLQNNIILQQNLQYGSTQELLSIFDKYRAVASGQGVAESAVFCVAETADQMYEVARANRAAVMNEDGSGRPRLRQRLAAVQIGVQNIFCNPGLL